MLAFGLCLALFSYWTILGAALLWPLEERMDRLRKLLLAPALGLVVNGIPLFLLNLAGVPVARSALPVGIILFAGAVALLWWSRPAAAAADAPVVSRNGVLEPRRSLFAQYLPFALVLVGGLVLTGRPMFLFNFDWVSFCNDDMANYCLGAHRVLDFGYFVRPDPEQLVRGRDYVQQMWFLHVPGMHRPGSEMVIAFLCAVTGKTAPEVFMVVILAMHLAQISALAALVYRSRAEFVPALVAAGLLAFSALASLGALYQLIAQVSGLAIAILAGVLLLRPMGDPDRAGPVTLKSHLKAGTLIGVAVAGLMVFYPEVFPFLAVTWLIYTAWGVARGRLPVRPMLTTLGVGTVVTVLLLNVYTSVSLAYLFMQASTGTRADNPQRTLFPYYLMPSGLSNLWGFQPLATLAMEPQQSVAIGAGVLLLVVVLVIAAVRTVRGDANATFALVMACVGLYLFKNRSGFGLYKLAMYAQPFFFALLVTAWLGWLRRRRAARSQDDAAAAPAGRLPGFAGGAGRLALAASPLLALAAINGYTQWFYVRSSCGVGQTFNEILDASDSRVYNEFRELVARTEAKSSQRGDHRYLVDSYNLVLAKFQSLGNRGREMAFPSNRFYYPGGYKSYPTPGGKRMIDAANDLMATYNQQFKWEGFRVRDVSSSAGDAPVSGNENAAGDAAGDGDASNTFLYNNLAADMASADDRGAGGNDVIVVATTGKQSPFNRRHVKGGEKTNFVARPSTDTFNHLVFVSSELGHPYFSGGRIKPNYAIYQLEAEPLFFRGHTMAGVGRHVLFQVINPSKDRTTGKPRVRMVLEMTGSYKADSDNALPPARVIGTGTVGFPGLVGRGSARAVSEPIEPQYINGEPYVQIDMGIEGKRFPEIRQGLMRLFGGDVAIDRRALVGFLRDISLVSDEQYAAFKGPSELSVFNTKRNDLRENPELEYSGIYEDGWISEHSFFMLRQPQGAAPMAAVAKGEVPAIAGGDRYFESKAQLLVDGKVVAEQVVHPGTFELRGEVPPPDPGTATSLAAAGTPRRVELRFSRFQHLPPVNGIPDGRPVAATLKYVGFQAQPVATPVAHVAPR